MKQYWLNIHATWQRLWLLTQVSPCYVFSNFRRTTWYGSANHSDNYENKYDKITFQLAYMGRSVYFRTVEPVMCSRALHGKVSILQNCWACDLLEDLTWEDQYTSELQSLWCARGPYMGRSIYFRTPEPVMCLRAIHGKINILQYSRACDVLEGLTWEGQYTSVQQSLWCARGPYRGRSVYFSTAEPVMCSRALQGKVNILQNSRSLWCDRGTYMGRSVYFRTAEPVMCSCMMLPVVVCPHIVSLLVHWHNVHLSPVLWGFTFCQGLVENVG